MMPQTRVWFDEYHPDLDETSLRTAAFGPDPATQPPLTLNQIIEAYQAGNLAKLSTDLLQLAQRKVNLYLTWHEQHPDFPYTVVPTASQLQPIRDGLDTILNARYGLDGMTPLHT